MEEALIEMYLAGVSVRVWRTSQKRFGAARCLATISELNKKAYVHIEDWRTALCKVGDIRMSMWMGSTCAVTGVESLKMWPFWWRSR